MADRLQQQIAISAAQGLHATTMLQLFERIGDEKAYFDLSQAQLTNLAGISNSIFADDYRSSLLDAAEKECAFVRENHVDTYFLTDDNYPHRLSQCEDAPLMLYKLGSCDLDKAHMVGIVGTRHCTIYGVDFTTKLVKELASKISDLVIVSGLAYGIDVTAHKAALEAGVPTVGVVAHGLSTIYPADHRSIAARMISSGGALVTEYRSDARIHRTNFLSRNRIIAGLCDCVIVVESDMRGGAMSTARTASMYNRDVFAVPGRTSDTYSRGTNSLIAKNIAAMLTCADDLINLMEWETIEDEAPAQPSLFKPLTPDQQRIFDLLEANGDATVNELCVKLGMSYAHISDNLFQMEMNDVVKALPGGRYAKI